MASVSALIADLIFLSSRGAVGGVRRGNVTKLIAKGNEFYRKGELAEAAKCFNQAIQLDPGNPVAWNNKGLILAIAGKYEQALNCHSKAVELDSGYVDAISNMGMAYTKLGRFDDALTHYDMALERQPRHETTLNNKGNLLAKMGRHDEAMECYDKALSINPSYLAAMNNKAVELIHLKRFEDALRLLNTVLKSRPLFAEGWYVKGKAFIGMGEFEKAMVCLERAHRLDSDFHQARKALEVLKRRLVSPPGAKTGAKEAPKKPRTEREMKNLEDRIEKEILQAGSEVEILTDEFEHPEERMTKEEAVAYEFISDEPQSKTAVKRRIGNRLSNPAFNRALEGLERKGLVSSTKVGRGFNYVRTEALGTIEEEVIEEPDTEAVVDAQSDRGSDFHALISDGRKFLAKGRFKEALSKFRRALIINPYDKMAICLKAQVHFELGERDKAINTISRILAKEPDFVPAWFTLANVTLKLKEYNDAADCFRKILELQPDNTEAQKGLGECEKATG